MDLGLRGRVAIVTGSSRGIGKAIAYGLASEGAKVTIGARNMNTVSATAREIASSTGADVLPIRVDLCERDDITSMVAETDEAFGRIDILVHNTGGPPATLFSETSDGDWDRAIDSLLRSVVTCFRAVVPYMQARKWGRLITMTSFAAKQPAERLVLSNTLRAGILGLTKTLANELAADGILVNAVCPGWTRTRRVEALAKSQTAINGRYEDVIDAWARTIPLQRLAQPEEIANLVVFLASEKASYVTGTAIQVDGGFIRSLI
jgi:3-oxoacyl-[acyl-carrier protein] reductase